MKMSVWILTVAACVHCCLSASLAAVDQQNKVKETPGKPPLKQGRFTQWGFSGVNSNNNRPPASSSLNIPGNQGLSPPNSNPNAYSNGVSKFALPVQGQNAPNKQQLLSNPKSKQFSGSRQKKQMPPRQAAALRVAIKRKIGDLETILTRRASRRLNVRRSGNEAQIAAAEWASLMQALELLKTVMPPEGAIVNADIKQDLTRLSTLVAQFTNELAAFIGSSTAAPATLSSPTAMLSTATATPSLFQSSTGTATMLPSTRAETASFSTHGPDFSTASFTSATAPLSTATVTLPVDVSTTAIPFSTDTAAPTAIVSSSIAPSAPLSTVTIAAAVESSTMLTTPSMSSAAVTTVTVPVDVTSTIVPQTSESIPITTQLLSTAIPPIVNEPPPVLSNPGVPVVNPLWTSTVLPPLTTAALPTLQPPIVPITQNIPNNNPPITLPPQVPLIPNPSLPPVTVAPVVPQPPRVPVLLPNPPPLPRLPVPPAVPGGQVPVNRPPIGRLPNGPTQAPISVFIPPVFRPTIPPGSQVTSLLCISDQSIYRDGRRVMRKCPPGAQVLKIKLRPWLQ